LLQTELLAQLVFPALLAQLEAQELLALALLDQLD
jgi:hypothetical protein